MARCGWRGYDGRMAHELTDKRAGEFELLARMVRLACEGRHGTRGTVCDECAALLDYAGARLARCPFGDEKPTCRQCTVHCYKPSERERVKEVMRYAGPRLLLRGDLGALAHLLHDRRSGKRKDEK